MAVGLATPKSKPQLTGLPPFGQELVAGTFAGWAQVFVGHPFDTVKVRLQTQKEYLDALDCFRKTLRRDGARGLYRGVTSPLVGIGACNAVLFGANSNFRRLFQGGSPRQLSLVEVGQTGALTGMVMAFVNCPVELLKVKLQTQNSAPHVKNTYKGVFDAGARIYAEQRSRGLYRGITITLLRDTPSIAAYFIVYDGTKRLLAKRHCNGDTSKLKPAQLLFAGGLAGMACWVPCYPQDVIKSTMQSDNRYKSTFECARYLVEQSRMKGQSLFRTFFRGFGPTMARAFPANAATFFAYEMAMKTLQSSSYS